LVISEIFIGIMLDEIGGVSIPTLHCDYDYDSIGWPAVAPMIYIITRVDCFMSGCRADLRRT